MCNEASMATWQDGKSCRQNLNIYTAPSEYNRCISLSTTVLDGPQLGCHWSSRYRKSGISEQLGKSSVRMYARLEAVQK